MGAPARAGEQQVKRMLFNATQAEELRRGDRRWPEAHRPRHRDPPASEQRKSNIYKAVITRVEPCSKPCFVDYGDERHGFLPFKEISRRLLQATASTSAAPASRTRSSEGQELHRPGREGRARQQGRGADDVHLAGRPLPRADAEQPARRRRLAPHRGRGPRRAAREPSTSSSCPNGMGVIARTAGIGRTRRRAAVGPELPAAALDARSKAPPRPASGAFLIYQESSAGHPRDPRLLPARHRRDPDRHRRRSTSRRSSS